MDRQECIETNARLLVVDDDAPLRDLLIGHLSSFGYVVSAVGDGVAFWQAWQQQPAPQLVILDVKLPGEDGFTIARELRQRSNVPLLMLTERGDEIDRVVGLEIGADDYIAKPFGPRELVARVRALLRRAGTAPDGPAQDADLRPVVFGHWTLEPVARHLVGADGVVVPLSGAEFKLLRVFLQSPGRILTRDAIMERLYGHEAGPFDRSVDILVSRLRDKLLDDARAPKLLCTVRGEGYVMTARPAAMP
jgi:two-component system, OmpR family, response regulator